MSAFYFLLVSLLVLGVVTWSPPALSMPYNARQVEEGYWVGGVPKVDDILGLQEAGITKVISLVKIEEDTLAAIEAAGIERVRLLFGTKFPRYRLVNKALGKTKPSQVYIHCEHGADRTGVFLAYALVTRHGWTVTDAFFAVLYPYDTDLTGIRELFTEDGISIDVDDDLVGKYSGAKNQGHGGLKVRHENYRTLVRTTIAEIEKEEG